VGLSPCRWGCDTVWADGIAVQAPDLTTVIFVDDFSSGDLRHWSAAVGTVQAP